MLNVTDDKAWDERESDEEDNLFCGDNISHPQRQGRKKLKVYIDIISKNMYCSFTLTGWECVVQSAISLMALTTRKLLRF